jgi:hypothetical protein
VYEAFFARIVQLCEQAGLVQGDILFVDSTLTQANASTQGLRSRSLLQQTLTPPAEFVQDLWVVNDQDREAPVQGREQDPFDKPSSSKSGVNHLCVSPADPDAQLFKKPGTTPILSHKTHFVVDGGRSNIITAVQVCGSVKADGRAVGELLDKHRSAVGRPARELVADRGYGSVSAINACHDREVQPLLGRNQSSNTHGGFSRTQFTYVPERDLYICPEGQELKRFRFKQTPIGAAYRPARGTCSGCRLRSQCVSGNGDRIVHRRPGEELVEEMLARALTPRSRRLMSRRRVISERINADAKDKHGMRRAQFRGRTKMQIQALLTAAAINLKQLASHRPETQSGRAVALSQAVLSPLSKLWVTLRPLVVASQGQARLQTAPG